MNEINSDSQNTLTIKYITYDYENGTSEVFDTNLFNVSSYEDLISQITDYYSSSISSGLYKIVTEDESEYIHHVNTNQPIESYLVIYKNILEAENDDEFNSKGAPFAFNHVFIPPNTINLGCDWSTFSEKLEFDTDEDVLNQWGLNKIISNPPEELQNASYDNFLEILFDTYKDLAYS